MDLDDVEPPFWVILNCSRKKELPIGHRAYQGWIGNPILQRHQQCAWEIVSTLSIQCFAGDPGFIETDIENIKKVTKGRCCAGVWKIHKRQTVCLTSFVPKGQMTLIAENSEKGPSGGRGKKENVEKTVVDSGEEIVKTPTNFVPFCGTRARPCTRLEHSGNVDGWTL